MGNASTPRPAGAQASDTAEEGPGTDARDGWLVLAAARPHPADVPVRRRRILARVIATAAAVIVAVAVVGIIASQRLAEAEAVNDAAKTADLIADTVVQPVITDGLLDGDAAALAALDAVVRDHVLGTTIVRVKIWRPDGRIVYSDEGRLIGRTFELEEEERDVLADPRIRADVSDLQSPENVYERANVKLLEAYRPVWTPSGQPLLFEAYFRYNEVTDRSGQLLRGFAGITLSSILVLVVLLVPVLWRLLDNLALAQQQRELLLRRAIDASAAERRRIAGTLHDGVVQDLAAASFSLAAAAGRATASGDAALADDLRSTAGTVRGSIGGLRSLLVDIYPPSLATAGLASALGDLAASLRSRGCEVIVETDEDVALDAEAERLVFRVTQEALANAGKHSGATRVRVALHRDGDRVQLDIEDDGRGFDAPHALARPAEGHFGLRVLGDVVAEAGAELSLRTSPGAGTAWRLRVDAP